MAYGGGTWITQNKVLPGSYINFVSAASASATLSDRGIVTLPLTLDWGDVGTMLKVTAKDFQKNSIKLFGYEPTAPGLRPLRELFRSAHTAYIYRLGTGGTPSANDYATAKYPGVRGNDLQIVINSEVDDPTLFDVSLYLGGTLVFDQSGVTTTEDLVDNDFITWKTGVALEATAGTAFSGGASPAVTNADYQTYLASSEAYHFNAVGCMSGDDDVKSLFCEWTKRMREEQGIKFQCVVYDCAADYEGVVNTVNAVTDEGADTFGLVPWVLGVIGGTAVNASATGRQIYNGEYTVNTNYTQEELIAAVKNGQFVLHYADGEVRLLRDINSLVTVTADKGEIFKSNQTIRVIDQIANDIAVLFNRKYLGVVPNDAAGRTSLWADIVAHHEQLQIIRAIEDFSSEDITIAPGKTKQAVVVTDLITVVNAMEQLYMTVTVQ